MRTTRRLVALLAVAALVTTAGTALAQTPSGPRDALAVAGLRQPVEVIRDRWGINHIYAQNEDDLFMAQGYLAAKDRLFQFEIWRRRATGTVAEILGPRELTRDIGTRLHKFRGNLDAELNHYHPRGKTIVEAYVRGVNAYVDEAMRDAGRAADRVPHARHHARQVDARGGHLAPPGADLERAERGHARARAGGARPRQAQGPAVAAGRRPAAHARSAHRCEDVPGRCAEDLQRLPRHHRLPARGHRAGVSRPGPRRSRPARGAKASRRGSPAATA